MVFVCRSGEIDDVCLVMVHLAGCAALTSTLYVWPGEWVQGGSLHKPVDGSNVAVEGVCLVAAAGGNEGVRSEGGGGVGVGVGPGLSHECGGGGSGHPHTSHAVWKARAAECAVLLLPR